MHFLLGQAITSMPGNRSNVKVNRSYYIKIGQAAKWCFVGFVPGQALIAGGAGFSR